MEFYSQFRSTTALPHFTERQIYLYCYVLVCNQSLLRSGLSKARTYISVIIKIINLALLLGLKMETQSTFVSIFGGVKHIITSLRA